MNFIHCQIWKEVDHDLDAELLVRLMEFECVRTDTRLTICFDLSGKHQDERTYHSHSKARITDYVHSVQHDKRGYLVMAVQHRLDRIPGAS